MRIADFVPNDFAINTIVRLHKINAFVTQYHTTPGDFGPITPTQQNLLQMVSPPISANLPTGPCPSFTHYSKPQLKPHQSLRMCSLTVHDESHSITLQLPDSVCPSPKVFQSLIEGHSVLVLRNACTLLDSQNCLFLTMASPKYSSIQVYNKTAQSHLDEDEYENDDCVISSFCDEKTESDLVEIMMKNVSSIPIKL